MTLFWLGFVIVGLFVLVVLRGAPYVPTFSRTVEQALDMLPLKPGDTLVDLGSGDGVFIKIAAKRGFKAIGYELNPILCLVAWLRCWRWRSQVSVRWRDFWAVSMPDQTNAVFVFLAGPYMNRFSKYLQKTMQKRTKPLWVVSHGFEVPGLTSVKQVTGLYLYKLLPPKR